MKVSNEATKAILPYAQTIATGSGTLWDATRDAFNVALRFYGAGKDAAAAVRGVITDELKGNPGSVKGYLSTLVWLRDKGHDSTKLSMGEATSLRYPPKPKLSKLERAQAVIKEAQEAQAQEAEKDATDPRRPFLRTIHATLATCDAAELEVIAEELVKVIATLRAEPEQEQEGEQAAAAA